MHVEEWWNRVKFSTTIMSLLIKGVSPHPLPIPEPLFGLYVDTILLAAHVEPSNVAGKAIKFIRSRARARGAVNRNPQAVGAFLASEGIDIDST